MNNVVFCLWIGDKITFEYALRMNALFTTIYKNDKRKIFIVYTDKIVQMKQSFFAGPVELSFLNSANVEVRSVDVLYQKYDECVMHARKQFKNTLVKTNITSSKQEADLSLCVKYNQDQQGTNCLHASSTQFVEHAMFRLRDNSASWASIYPSYIYHLRCTQMFGARVTLNLRQLALSIHGGLYIDVDVMCDCTVSFYELNAFLEIYYKVKRYVKEFRKEKRKSEISHHNCKKLFMILIKKMKYQHFLPKSMEVNLNHSNAHIYMQQIDEYLRQVEEYYYGQFTFRVDFLKTSTPVADNVVYSDGIYGMSQKMSFFGEHCSTGRFTQCILYVSGRLEMKIIENAVIQSIYFNMLVAMIQPGKYIVIKTNDVNYISPFVQCQEDIGVGKSQNNSLICKKLMKIVLPSDIFFTREKFPYMIIDDHEFLHITFRTGRLLHPLSQISTRGAWNFFIAYIQDFQEVDGFRLDCGVNIKKYSARFSTVSLYPESTIVNARYQLQHQPVHWTKCITVNFHTI